jgi:DNA-binding Xre family transcriptional regulator
MSENNAFIGSSLDDFLHEEGILPECEAEANKRIVAWQLEQYMQEHNLKKTEFAERLGTSRSQLNRLLDAKDTSINLNTMARIARAMGKTFRIQFEQRSEERP